MAETVILRIEDVVFALSEKELGGRTYGNQIG